MSLSIMVAQMAKRELVQIHGIIFLDVLVTHNMLLEGLIRAVASFLRTRI